MRVFRILSRYDCSVYIQAYYTVVYDSIHCTLFRYIHGHTVCLIYHLTTLCLVHYQRVDYDSADCTGDVSHAESITNTVCNEVDCVCGSVDYCSYAKFKVNADVDHFGETETMQCNRTKGYTEWAVVTGQCLRANKSQSWQSIYDCDVSDPRGPAITVRGGPDCELNDTDTDTTILGWDCDLGM